MKKTFLVSVLLVKTVYLLCQVSYLEVEYKSIQRSHDGTDMIYYDVLKDNGVSSLSLEKDTNAYKGTMITMPIDKKKSKGFYIDRLTNQLFYYSPIFTKDAYVREDSLTFLFKWKITDTVVKEIFGYKCKLATCTFRGRDYEAYFAEQLPFSSGPWKLCGLPGVILEALTTDGIYKASAYQLRMNIPHAEICNPYDTKKLRFLSFAEEKRIELKKLKELEKKAQAEEKDNDTVYTFEDSSLEILQQ